MESSSGNQAEGGYMTGMQFGSVLRRIRELIDSRAASDRSDSDLLERFVRERDEIAFEAIVRRHGPLVLGVCRRILFDPQDVEDAFQATFLVLVRKANSIGRRERLGNWLYGVAQRIAVRARAYAARRRARERQVEDTAAVEPSGDALWRDLSGVLDEEVRRLPEKYRTPFLMCYLEGKTNDEAAQALGCPRGTVATRLARARDRLRRRLLRRGVTLSAGLLAATLARNATAAVPETLVGATVQTAMLVAAGRAVVAAPIAFLMEGVMHEMLIHKLKVLATVVLTVGLSVGAGVLGYRALAADPKKDDPKTPLQTAERPDPKKKDEPKGKEGDEAKPALAWRKAGNWQASSGKIVALALSANGKYVATAGEPGDPLKINEKNDFEKQLAEMLPKLWDAPTGKKQATLGGQMAMGNVGAMAFSPDGQTVVVADVNVTFWDAAKAKVKRSVNEQITVTALAFSPDGKNIAGVRADGIIRVYDAETTKVRHTLRPAKNALPASSLAITPDGKYLASGDANGTATIWDLSNGKVKTTHKLKAGPLVFSPDGQWVAGDAGRGAVDVWDLSTGKLKTTLKGPAKDVEMFQLAFTPDGKTLAAGGLDGALILWDLAAEKELVTLKGHKTIITGLAFAGDGKTLASSDQNGNVFVWALKEEAAKGK
jgi:RNA polymerase sigma factor (sigma-70 family)